MSYSAHDLLFETCVLTLPRLIYALSLLSPLQVTVFRCQEDVTEFAKVIARRLQRMGDTYQNTISEATLRDLTTIIASPQPSPDADSAHLRTLLNTLTANLSLSRVFQIFVLLHQLIRELVTVFGNKPSVAHDRRWDLFQELMDQTITRVTRWICSNGGWVSRPPLHALARCTLKQIIPDVWFGTPTTWLVLVSTCTR